MYNDRHVYNCAAYQECDIVVRFLFLCQGGCDLASLLQVMVVIFGEFPPVCMQPYPEPEQASCK